MSALILLCALLQLFPTNPWPKEEPTEGPRARFVNIWWRNDERIPGGHVALVVPESGEARLIWRDGSETGDKPHGLVWLYFGDTPRGDTLTGLAYFTTDPAVLPLKRRVSLTLLGNEMASLDDGEHVMTFCGWAFKDAAPAEIQSQHPCG